MPPSVLDRLLWLTCVAWAGALGLATPQAASGSAPDQAPGTPRPDLQLFVHSQDCVACHNQLSTPAGEDVSIGSSWRATMMANSARDPYWQAAVRRETLDHPGHADMTQVVPRSRPNLCLRGQAVLAASVSAGAWGRRLEALDSSEMPRQCSGGRPARRTVPPGW